MLPSTYFLMVMTNYSFTLHQLIAWGSNPILCNVYGTWFHFRRHLPNFNLYLVSILSSIILFEHKTNYIVDTPLIHVYDLYYCLWNPYVLKGVSAVLLVSNLSVQITLLKLIALYWGPEALSNITCNFCHCVWISLVLEMVSTTWLVYVFK